MPSPEFSKKLTSIISDTDLSKNIRYDIICRLLCQTLGIHSVSMLTYRANLDKLKCIGFYLANPGEANLNNNYFDIITYLPYFEFLADCSDKELERKTLDDYTESIYYLNPSKQELISTDKFISLKSLWKSTYKYRFMNYKTKIHEEEHDINNSSISGEYFNKLINSSVKKFDRPHVLKIAEGPQKGKLFYKGLNELGLNINIDNLYYIGLPLYTNQKYIGILRLTAYNDHAQSMEISNFINSPKDSPQIEELLGNFSQLISLNLKANFYLDSLRKINQLVIDKNYNSKIDKDEINEAADYIAAIINCNGCLIRFNEKNENNSPTLKGCSINLLDYVKLIETKEDQNFSNDIMDVFKNEKHENCEILAINFSVKKDTAYYFETKEYYYNKDGNLKHQLFSDKRKFSGFTEEYVQDLVTLKMEEIVVIKLKEVQSPAYIVLTNTKNKKFTTSDIEILLLTAKKAGEQIKHFLDIEHISEMQKQSSYLTSMRIVMHQIGARLSASASNVDNFAKGRLFPREWNTTEKNSQQLFTATEYDINKIRERAKEIGKTLKQAMKQIAKNRKIYELYENPIVPEIAPIYDLHFYLLRKCRDFDSLAYKQKNIKIWLTKVEDLGVKVETDIDLLNEVIDNLIDNAVKYSYHRDELSKHNISYNEGKINGEGNILVSYWNLYDSLKIQVTNWGKIIKTEDKKIIFDIFKRGGNSDKVSGSGIGLFLVKKILESLSGSIEVSSSNHQTTFTIVIKKIYG